MFTRIIISLVFLLTSFRTGDVHPIEYHAQINNGVVGTHAGWFDLDKTRRRFIIETLYNNEKASRRNNQLPGVQSM